MQICVAIQLENSTYRRFSRHSSWFFLQTGNQGYSGIPSQKTTTTPVEVKTSSSDVAGEKQFFFTQTDGEVETEEQTFERKEQSRKSAADL